MYAPIAAQMADTVDLRDYDKYKNCPSRLEAHFEGVCSSSWAIAVAMAANDEYCSADVAVNKDIRFSYQNMMECCSKCHTGYDNGCYGGNFVEAMDYVINTGAVQGNRNMDSLTGLCSAYRLKECYLNPEFVTASTPLCSDDALDMNKAVAACSKTCVNNTSQDYPASLKKIKSKSTVQVVSNTNYAETMKTTISGSNILITEMVIFEDLYAYKKGDIYVHLYGRSVGTVIVNIIGYGNDSVTKQDYWLVRIPWGEAFGDKGVIKVQRGTNNCGIESPNNSYFFTAK